MKVIKDDLKARKGSSINYVSMAEGGRGSAFAHACSCMGEGVFGKLT